MAASDVRDGIRHAYRYAHTYKDIERKLGIAGFILVDDGTMDTVLECVTCGEEERCNPSPFEEMDSVELESLTDEDAFWHRLTDAIDSASYFHDCQS